ncbi:HAD-IA family hydrolase [Asticcacaulis sp. YBE204]|uniref:HAD-IA family hydrolase n=1 Tax=Asticcacaulis sp. YBE204 TaxID=1282363 RepID=UPI0003C409FB|nr:HAD-IA family hydrolase [Asticcacaulis sp. YBE204]ESQ78769.1 haloacid dehalogenase [Asticcacaulis sp. YBE204]
MATRTNLRLAVFDVDGTLVDSRASIHRAAVEGAKAINIDPPNYDEVRSIVGLSLFEALQAMRPELDPETVAAYTREFQNAFLTFHADPDFTEALYAGAHETLLRLKNDNWLIGMATGNSRRGVTRIVDRHGWKDIFDVTFCADDGPSKPHPHMLQCNLTALGVGTHQAVMIGDATHDIRMARTAQVHAIGVSWGFHTVEELQDAGAHEIVHDFKALERSLEAFSINSLAPVGRGLG